MRAGGDERRAVTDVLEGSNRRREDRDGVGFGGGTERRGAAAQGAEVARAAGRDVAELKPHVGVCRVAPRPRLVTVGPAVGVAAVGVVSEPEAVVVIFRGVDVLVRLLRRPLLARAAAHRRRDHAAVAGAVAAVALREHPLLHAAAAAVDGGVAAGVCRALLPALFEGSNRQRALIPFAGQPTGAVGASRLRPLAVEGGPASVGDGGGGGEDGLGEHESQRVIGVKCGGPRRLGAVLEASRHRGGGGGVPGGVVRVACREAQLEDLVAGGDAIQVEIEAPNRGIGRRVEGGRRAEVGTIPGVLARHTQRQLDAVDG